MKYLWTLLILVLFTLPASAQSGDGKTERIPAIGYRDADGDGKNDLFRDANGDGKNDVTGEEYPHRFRFTDENGDGVNDSFRDADGDGMNDAPATRDSGRKREEQNLMLDVDGDGINDVTGRRNQPPRFMRRRFIDENADGLADRSAPRQSEKANIRGQKMDRFSDRDGDGINDGRGLERDNRDRFRDMEDRNTRGQGRERGRDK